MTDGLIMDTILHFGEILMSGVSRVVFPALAYIVYIFLSFFIPSSSGLATATIPIIGSLGEFLGVGKEFAVMVCAAGSETMNLISPTQAVLMGALAIAGVPFPRWVKAVLPFFFIVIAIVSYYRNHCSAFINYINIIKKEKEIIDIMKQRKNQQ